MLMLDNSPAQNWLKRNLKDVEVVTGNLDSSNLPDVVVIDNANRSKVQEYLEATGWSAPVLVVLGEENDRTQKINQELITLGIPDEWLLTCSPGETIRASKLLEAIRKVMETEVNLDPPVWSPNDPQEFSQPSVRNLKSDKNTSSQSSVNDPGDKQYEINDQMPVAKATLELEEEQVKINPGSVSGQLITIASVKRGCGTTTIAASLAGHVAETGYKAALVDLGKPSCAGFHLGLPDVAKITAPAVYDTRWGTLVVPDREEALPGILDELRGQYDVVILNAPNICDPSLLHKYGGKIIVIMDRDLQTFELTASYINNLNDYILVVNRSSSFGVPVAAIGRHLGKEALVIEQDTESCWAALAAGEPAANRSTDVSAGIGSLAAALGLFEGGDGDV